MSNIIDLKRKRFEKQLAIDLARGRQPLIISHGKVLTGPEVLGEIDWPSVSVSDSLKRISESIRQINELCKQLKIDSVP